VADFFIFFALVCQQQDVGPLDFTRTWFSFAGQFD
jgi:hypothetical protein